MKRLFLLLTLLLLLTGCQTEPPVSTTPATTPPTSTPPATAPATTPPETTPPTEVPETTQPTEPLNLSLLDHAEAAGTFGNLMYIPNSHVESMLFPEILRYGNDLLLYEVMPTGLLQLKLVSLADGSLLAEASYSMSPAALVQVENGIVSICDYGSGQILILNESLLPEKSYQVPVEGAIWYLNPETEILYEFFPEAGLLSRDLVTGQTRWILDNAAFLQPYDAENGYVLFAYTDRADQITYYSCLDLSTATLETVPVEGSICAGVRHGQQWLLRQDFITGKYILIHSGAADMFVLPEGFSKLLPDKSQLLMTDGDYRELYLYDLDGTFRSHCALPQMEYASVGTDLIWSDFWQGYFFQDSYDGIPHLMFWDPSIPQEGEDLSLTPLEANQPLEHMMEQQYYDRAAALSQRFGVEICIAEQCALEYSQYNGEILADPYYVQNALDTLEQALGVYPEGFFRQLLCGNLKKIRIELVVGLRGNDNLDNHPNIVNGFVEEPNDYYLLVLDCFSLESSTVYHEFSHIIDTRLEWDAMLRPEALYSEETWLSLQPEGFRYADTYGDIPADILAFEYSGYFARRYGMTFPTEDRSTLMALVMSDSAALEGNPGMAEKMRYYAACIRDCFDTTGWPETLPWEQALN